MRIKWYNKILGMETEHWGFEISPLKWCGFGRETYEEVCECTSFKFGFFAIYRYRGECADSFDG